MVDFQSFPRFGALPSELRIAIWNMTIEGRIVKEGCDFRGPMSSAAPHRSPPGIFLACYESRAIALKEYEPFMGTYLHLKLDILSIRGLYFDYLGADWITTEELSDRSAGRMSLREPFSKVHVIFTGPWASKCDCSVAERDTPPKIQPLLEDV